MYENISPKTSFAKNKSALAMAKQIHWLLSSRSLVQIQAGHIKRVSRD
jgi:hypothetical protein